MKRRLPRADEPPLLNRVVTPLAGIQIDSGRLERIEFRVTGNDARSEVQMTMLYDGLDVEMVKRQPDGRLKERRDDVCR